MFSLLHAIATLSETHIHGAKPDSYIRLFTVTPLATQGTIHETSKGLKTCPVFLVQFTQLAYIAALINTIDILVTGNYNSSESVEYVLYVMN